MLDEIAAMSPRQREAFFLRPEQAVEIVNQLYAREKLLLEAQRRALAEQPQVQKALRRAANQVLTRELLESVRATIVVPDLQPLAKQYYDAHIEEFTLPERRRASHILVKPKDGDQEMARRLANEYRLAVRGGEDFSGWAKVHSDDSASAAKGGDLGWVKRGTMVPAFETALFAIEKPGDISEIVETNYGFHIIRLHNVESAKVKPYDEVKEAIVSRLAADYVRDHLETWRREITKPTGDADVNREAIAEAYNKAQVVFSQKSPAALP